MDMLEITVDLIEGGIHTFFLCFGLPKKEKNLSWLLKLIICLLFYTVSSYCFLDRYSLAYIDGVLIILRLLIISSLLCEGAFFQRVVFCVLGDMITSISGMLTATLVPVFLKTSIGNTLEHNGSSVRIIALSFAKFCQLGLSIIVILLVHRMIKEAEKNIWVPLSFMLLFSAIITHLMTTYYRIENESNKNIVFIIAMVLSMIESMVVFWIFLKILKNERENTRLTAFIDQMDREVASVNENEKNLEEIRGLKHEIRNEYILIKELINNGKPEEAVEKLTDIIEDAEDSFSRVLSFDSGSASVNAVLNYYIRRLYQIGADVQYSIEKLNAAKENEKTICSILLNLLKNAYEKEIKLDDKAVIIEMKSEMKYIKILIENRIEESVFDNNSELQTTKSDKENHGFGIKSVKKIVNAQGGNLTISEKNGWFVAEVWLSVN